MDSTTIPRVQRHAGRWVAMTVLATGLLLGGGYGIPLLLRIRADGQAIAQLHSAIPEERKRGAWRAADEKLPRALAYVAGELDRAAEEDPDVRESYAWALGRAGTAAEYHTLASLTLADPDGVVRAAAWLAMARLNPERTLDLARTGGPGPNEWDRLGRSHARLEAGDLSAVGDVFEIAQAGDDGQRLVACRALLANVVPLLDAVGRYPQDAPPLASGPWAREVVADLAGRTEGINLQPLADDVRRQMARSAGTRRQIAKITKARERIVALLYSERAAERED